MGYSNPPPEGLGRTPQNKDWDWIDLKKISHTKFYKDIFENIQSLFRQRFSLEENVKILKLFPVLVNLLGPNSKSFQIGIPDREKRKLFKVFSAGKTKIKVFSDEYSRHGKT